MPRVNLAVNPSLRNGTTQGYVPLGGAQLSITDDYAYYGKYALLVTKDDVNGSGVQTENPIPVVAGLPYAFSWKTRLPVTIPEAEHSEILMQVDWQNSTGVIVSTVTSATLLMDDDSEWYSIGGVWTAPPGTTFADVSLIQPLAGSEDAPFIVDALLVEQANYIGGYFDNISTDDKYTIARRALTPMPQVINGLRLGADIVLNDLVMNTIDEDDTIWVVTDLDGWWGQTNPEMPDIPRGTEDGSYDVEGRLTARTITLSGFFIPKNPEQALTDSINRLVMAANLVRKGGWLYTHEGPTKAAFVRLSAKPTVRTVNARGRTEFSITLRAGDPIKYHWDDSDPDGYTNLQFEAADVIGMAENIGTATVTGNFTFTGPAGAGTRVYNASTNETMTLQEPLRGAGLVATVYEATATDGIATVKTVAPNHLRPGDEISLVGMIIPFSSSTETRIVTAVSEVFPYSFSFAINTDDITPVATGGQVVLLRNDTLMVDTYNRSVTYNGEQSGHRHRLTVLTDWIHFGPGENIIEFSDDLTEVEVVSKQLTSNEVTLVTADTHYLIPGEQIVVNLPTDVPLSKKRLTGNVVTLTTDGPHGFSVGDVVSVASTTQAQVVSKSRASNVATLTTQAPHGINVSDSITVALPATVAPIAKSITSNVATITTQQPHGFSAGDSVMVAMPTTASLANKQLTNNQVTLTTTAPHNFVVGDSITVTMPAGASITNKARSGSQAVITTATAHGFSVGDSVIITLPTTANISGNVVTSGANRLATVTTSAAHNFSVGDRVTVTISGVTSRSISTMAATTTTVTAVTTAAHNLVVGDFVTIQDTAARFDGEYYVASVPNSTTFTYASSGAAVSSTSYPDGTVYNNTLGSFITGPQVVETIPTSTTFTFRTWKQFQDNTRPTSGATVTNNTNQSYNGTKTLVSASGTTFAYNY